MKMLTMSQVGTMDVKVFGIKQDVPVNDDRRVANSLSEHDSKFAMKGNGVII